MDDKQELYDLCNHVFGKTPMSAKLSYIKNKFLCYIDKPLTEFKIKGIKETLSIIDLTEPNISNFDDTLIEIIDRQVPVTELLFEVLSMPNNWLINQLRQKNRIEQQDTETINLIKGVPIFLGNDSFEKLFNSPVYRKTKEYDLYPVVTAWLDSFAASNNLKIARVAIVRLQIDGKVLDHVDYGEYYATRDRYHLCLDGDYVYTVFDRSETIRKGTLFKFNNKVLHSALNISDVPRICLIFDTEKLPVKNLQTPV